MSFILKIRHLFSDIQVQCVDAGSGSPTHACWEEPGCIFFHLSAHRESPSIEANCHQNPKGRESLWMSGSCIYLIHLKAKLLRSCKSLADDLSLETPKSYSAYLVLFPSAEGHCKNVSSNRLCCKRSYLRSTAYLLPALTKLSHNSFKCMLQLSSKMWYVIYPFGMKGSCYISYFHMWLHPLKIQPFIKVEVKRGAGDDRTVWK